MLRSNSPSYAFLAGAESDTLEGTGTRESTSYSLDTGAVRGASRQPGERIREALAPIGARLPADCGFVEGDNFQSFIGLIILLNILVLWGETDAPDLKFWLICDHIFLLIFLSEIVLRVVHRRPEGFFCGKDKLWAYLDTAIVGLAVFALWVVPLCVNKGGQTPSAAEGTPNLHGSGSNSSLLRFLRLMRLLRLLRVFKMFHQLMVFVNALRDMFGTFIWIFVVLSIFILTFAISFTHLLGHGEALGPRGLLLADHAEALATIHAYFKDVPTSLFTLFQLTTTDNWDDIALPLIELNPWWRVFFVFFIAFASWSMISVLTAVASNKMIAATADRKELEAREQERKYQAFVEFLRDSFRGADSDGNGVLDMSEFTTMISQDFVHRRMKELGVHMSRADLLKAWEMIDIDESGELTIDEFVTGLSTLQEGLTTKHMVSVDYSLKRVTLKTEARLDGICRETDEIVEENTRLHEKMRESAELDAQLSLWLQWRGHSEFSSWLQQHLPPPPAAAPAKEM